MKRVLVVDDERRARRVLQIMIEGMGLESVSAEDGPHALAHFQERKVDLVLTDLRMPGMSGIELLGKVRELDPEVPVVVLTAYGTVQTAVDAMKQGAFDYVLRPFDVEALEAVVRKALELRQYKTENRYLKEQVQGSPETHRLRGGSPAIRHVTELLEKVGPTRSSVLITGETGTGKELAARAIHELSPRRGKLFVALNCAAIPTDLLESELFGHKKGAFTGAQSDRTGKFEVADGGTLFLDEIGDMRYALQAKLLRVLQEGVIEPVGSNRQVNVDVRVVSSTNRDLGAAIAENRFREDLYYRLNVFHVHLPPLRDRPEDLALLAGFFLEEYARELGKPVPRLSKDAIAVLEGHRWPGNVRELRNLMERVAVLNNDPVIEARNLRALVPDLAQVATTEMDEATINGTGFALEPAVAGVERKLILRALGETGDNKAHAARLLGVSERTLWYKLKKYQL